MNNLPATTVQPPTLIEQSLQHAIAISFPKSTSASYDAAVNVAEHATYYRNGIVGKTLFHHAAFGKSRDQASLALALCGYIRSLKGVQYYGGGKMLLGWVAVESVLLCYLEATACTDFRAHCYRTLDEDRMYRRPREPGVTMGVNIFGKTKEIPVQSPPRYLLPCTYLLKTQFGIDEDHPSSPIDQIQAAGIERGCDWCPNFSPKEFKRL